MEQEGAAEVTNRDRRRRFLGRIERPAPVGPPIEPPSPAAPSVGDDGVPMVPFVPVRCPGCEADKPRTTGVHRTRAGRVRYHLCKVCGQRFRSLEVQRPGEDD